MDYLFIDESGNVHPNGSNYIVIVGIILRNNKKPLE